MTDKTERHECPNCAHWLTIQRPDVDNTALKLIEQMAEALEYWASALGSLQPRTLQLWQSNGLLKTAEALTAYEAFKKGENLCADHRLYAGGKCPVCLVGLDDYGNKYGEFKYCSFPDCGCDGHRLCMAKKGPSGMAYVLNKEKGGK